MEGVAHEVETCDAETTSFVFVDMCLLEADDVDFLSFRNGADDAAGNPIICPQFPQLPILQLQVP
jgi:hypothetical protein